MAGNAHDPVQGAVMAVKKTLIPQPSTLRLFFHLGGKNEDLQAQGEWGRTLKAKGRDRKKMVGEEEKKIISHTLNKNLASPLGTRRERVAGLQTKRT